MPLGPKNSLGISEALRDKHFETFTSYEFIKPVLTTNRGKSPPPILPYLRRAQCPEETTPPGPLHSGLRLGAATSNEHQILMNFVSFVEMTPERAFKKPDSALFALN